MYVVNLLGEPGVGKSASSWGAAYEFAVNNFKVELVNEVAKGFAWETPKDPNSGQSLIHPIFGQQIYLLGEQNRWLERVNNQRDIAVMECPLIMTAVYQPDDYLKDFTGLVLEQFRKYNNINFLIERNHNFDPSGRVHDEKESQDVRRKLIEFLEKHKLPYIKVKTARDVNKKIVKYVQQNYFKDKGLLEDYKEVDISNLIKIG
jgi:hypothetical protein